MAGAYWAVLSLRCAPSELVTSVYGQVHMLSHVLGGYNRNAIQRLAAAEKQVAELTRQRDAALSAKLELERAKEKRICELESGALPPARERAGDYQRCRGSLGRWSG